MRSPKFFGKYRYLQDHQGRDTLGYVDHQPYSNVAVSESQFIGEDAYEQPAHPQYEG